MMDAAKLQAVGAQVSVVFCFEIQDGDVEVPVAEEDLPLASLRTSSSSNTSL